jgi:hypothetical protein
LPSIDRMAVILLPIGTVAIASMMSGVGPFG